MICFGTWDWMGILEIHKGKSEDVIMPPKSLKPAAAEWIGKGKGAQCD